MQNLPSHSSGLAGHAGHLRSKSNLPSRAATPSSSQTTISEEPTKLSHRLKHLFDHTKTANFQVSVTIHSLTNVPQLSGEFAVDWKFRGKAPRAKDAGEYSEYGMRNAYTSRSTCYAVKTVITQSQDAYHPPIPFIIQPLRSDLFCRVVTCYAAISHLYPFDANTISSGYPIDTRQNQLYTYR